jgi:gliding motility-associated-like protein
MEESETVYAPNIISLGSVIESNQIFVLYGGLGVQKIESLNIFDRWGDLLFSKADFLPNDEKEGWNGVYRGNQVSPGVYIWVARILYKDGNSRVSSGDFTIIR